MSVGFITKTFFQRYDLLWKGNSLQDLYSRDPEQFLPLILLLVDAASSKKFGLNLIISHKLIANNQALFGFSTAEAICTNPHMVENAFEKMAELYHFAYGTDRTITLKKETCFTEMMGHFRESLKHEPNGEMISAANHEQLYANVLTWLRVKDRHQPVEFSIDTVCKSSHSRTKQLFEEMTIVAVAKHLTANPELSVENLKEDNQLKLEVDEKVLLAAALFNSDMLGALSSHFSCLSYQLAFDEDVYTLRENIRSTATTRTFGEPSRSWYQYAKQLVTKLALNNSLKQVFAYSYGHQGIDFNRLVAVLLQSNAPVVSALKSTNQTNNITVRNAIASQQMRIALNKKVIGQEHAIKSLCQGYLTSTIQSQTGPRTIYTFAGPSGVGKTYLASQLQSELNAIEKSGYKFSIFNMENYIDEKDTMKLFGSGS